MPKTFQAIAEENKDKGFVFTEKTMAQSAYTMVNSEGICAAFSMAYIKSQRKGRGKTGFHYFDDDSSTPNKQRSEEAIRKRYEIIQDIHVKPSNAKGQIDAITKRLTDHYQMR
ncbi:MAG TPA: hypothetical protein VE860_22625, partial [Chthoniobacterales bacterium]|nr:hypothetical protein [Chthoniobacterales bacterium]